MAQARFQSKKLLQKKRQQKIIRYIVAVTVVVFLLGGFYFISNLQQLQISTINYFGNTLVTEEELQEVVAPIIEGKSLFLFSRKNALFFSRKKITKNLLEQYPQIKTVEINLQNKQTILITVSEYVANAVWCVDTSGANNFTAIIDANVGVTDENLTPEIDCYQVNESGFIFDEFPLAGLRTENDLLILSGPDTQESYITTSLLDESVYQNIITIISSIADKFPIVVRHTYLADEQDVLVQVATEISPQDYTEIRFSLYDNGNLLLANLQSALAEYNDRGQTIDDFEYIDLRFGNKVFFKLKTTPEEESETYEESEA